ncbi:MAG: alpha/beta hydrolase fold domain-containing protein [Bacteroidota bacterium]
MEYIHQEKQSTRAKIIKLVMKAIGFQYRYERMLKKMKFNDVAAKMPKSFLQKFLVEKNTFLEHATWTITPKSEKSKKVILFLHGGGFVNNLVPFHWKFVEQIVLNTNATIVVVDYPLAPKYSHLETFEMVDAVYQDLLLKHSSSNIIFMGDSAGGGISLGFAQVLRNENRPLPQQLILLCPCIDLTGTNPGIAALEKHDYLLTMKAIPVVNLYTKDTPKDDFRLSPLLGNFDSLPPITCFTGTYEMLHVDSVALNKKLNQLKIPHNYFVYPKMFHVWMAVTFLKESKIAVQQIAKLIKENTQVA